MSMPPDNDCLRFGVWFILLCPYGTLVIILGGHEVVSVDSASSSI